MWSQVFQIYVTRKKACYRKYVKFFDFLKYSQKNRDEKSQKMRNFVSMPEKESYKIIFHKLQKGDKTKMSKQKNNALGDDPLFNDPTQEETFDEKDLDFSEIVSNEKLEAVKKTLKDMKHEVKKLEQRKRNREDDYQRMTFIIRKDLLNKLRDYCYTERVSQKVGLEQALVAFFEDKELLFTHPERPKQVHERDKSE